VVSFLLILPLYILIVLKFGVRTATRFGTGVSLTSRNCGTRRKRKKIEGKFG
jgi:hypothetical protein